MSKRRKNAGEGYGYMFSGAFSKKADAVKKERERKGSFVKAVYLPSGMRYAVMTPRTNPPKRRPKEAKAPKVPKVTPATNPAELLVMGANPASGKQQEIKIPIPGGEVTIRTNPAESATNPLFSFHPGLLTGKQQRSHYGRQPFNRRVAGMLRKRRGAQGSSGEGSRALRSEVAEALVGQGYKLSHAKKAAKAASGADFSSLFHSALDIVRRENPICGAAIGGYKCTRKPGHRGPHLPQGATMRTRHRLPKNWQPNPSVEAIREGFTGASVNRVQIMHEPHMRGGDYALLGKLLELHVKPRKGGQVLSVTLNGVSIVADDSARQIYFVGGDQDVSADLQVFGALDRGAGIFELGEARRIDYKQRKEHVSHPEMDAWRHEFGEETGERPTVLFDSNNKRLLLEGGAYEIRPEGIVN